MMNNTDGWMGGMMSGWTGGGMWGWPVIVICLFVFVLLIVVIGRTYKK